MAIPNTLPTEIGACVEGTATTDGTTGVALPAGRQFIITNIGSVTLYVKTGASTGPDASSTTVGGGRMPIPAGSVQTFSKKRDDTHAYLYCATTSAYSIVGADGQ